MQGEEIKVGCWLFEAILVQLGKACRGDIGVETWTVCKKKPAKNIAGLGITRERS